MKTIQTFVSFGIITLGASVANGGVAVIDAVSSAGSGCAAESIAADISDDGLTLRFVGIDLNAKSGPNISIAESRKACTVSLKLSHDPAMTFRVVEATIPYSTRLEVDASAKITGKAWHQASATEASVEFEKSGSLWEAGTATFPLNSEFQPCGSTRAVNLSFSASTLAEDGVYGRMRVTDPVVYSLEWVACP